MSFDAYIEEWITNGWLEPYDDKKLGYAKGLIPLMAIVRRLGTNVAIVDLRRAYLQIRVHESQWPYQTVIFRGQMYCLTRLGFGLNVVPSVMAYSTGQVPSHTFLLVGRF